MATGIFFLELHWCDLVLFIRKLCDIFLILKRMTRVTHVFFCVEFQISLCYKDPASHPFISKEERDYLEAEIGQLERNETLPATPWTKILTSAPVIALTISQVMHLILKLVIFLNIFVVMFAILRLGAIGVIFYFKAICQNT